ncbi:cation efflux family-domain-containing protein [Lipomyces oligophaga]|uniref:cation efflux family-domain-containing protein n=1 Tax=Lipomyces oligophaga TaxID=45792 RepID=UPI0034CD83BD
MADSHFHSHDSTTDLSIVPSIQEQGSGRSNGSAHSHSHGHGHSRGRESVKSTSQVDMDKILMPPPPPQFRLQRTHTTPSVISMPSAQTDSNIELSLSMIRQPMLFVQTLLAHSDTRSIFLYLMLNFVFMLVQFLYSILSHSLGLLSDSIHMLLDCLALLVGLLASVMSKWPPSASFPYGLDKVESLSGFVNGILLIGISFGIVSEAFERIWRPVEIERVTELLVVSFLGLVVNLVGIMAFNHGHAGHGHSHGHSHSHSHSDEHKHDHEHKPKVYDKLDLSDPNVSPPSSPAMNNDLEWVKEECHESHEEKGHQHNENMHGLFLHILADTLGSVGVIVSTLLTSRFGWSGFDPLASLFIAVLIFSSAVPLVKSSANSLLLSLTAEQEYSLRNALSDVLTVPGVLEYSSPRFWPAGEGGNSSSIRGAIHIRIANEADMATVRQKVDERIRNSIKNLTDVFIQFERASSITLNGI